MKNSVSKSKGRFGIRGFTLIELLVVIVIIAILAAILFPVFSRARDRGRVAACQSNMKQIGLAIQQYLDEWNSYYPDHASVTYPSNEPEVRQYLGRYSGGSYSNAMGGAWIKWFSHRYRYKEPSGIYQPAGFARTVSPYIRNLDVFKCSSEWKDRPGIVGYDVGSSYYVKLAMQHYADNKMRPLRTAEIRYTTKTTLLYEEVWHNDGYDRPYLFDVAFWQGNPNRPPARRVHAIFMDGHVGTINVPWHGTSGFDPNWYFYRGGTANKQTGHYANIERGDRDVW